MPPKPQATVAHWLVSPGLTDYAMAVSEMQQRARAIRQATAPEVVWLVEHPPLYTAGTSAQTRDLIEPNRFPVHQTGRGGQYTYHGPGQRVAYVMLDVGQRMADVRLFVRTLEDWLIAALATLGVAAGRRDGRVGIWVARPERGAKAEDKIAAIGIRLTRWVSLHGVSLNVYPDLRHYDGIVPCGISDHGVTSLADLGITVSMARVDDALRTAFLAHFGPLAPSSRAEMLEKPEPAR